MVYFRSILIRFRIAKRFIADPLLTMIFCGAPKEKLDEENLGQKLLSNVMIIDFDAAMDHGCQ